MRSFTDSAKTVDFAEEAKTKDWQFPEFGGRITFLPSWQKSYIKGGLFFFFLKIDTFVQILAWDQGWVDSKEPSRISSLCDAHSYHLCARARTRKHAQALQRSGM